jgi:hypothetical protein
VCQLLTLALRSLLQDAREQGLEKCGREQCTARLHEFDAMPT